VVIGNFWRAKYGNFSRAPKSALGSEGWLCAGATLQGGRSTVDIDLTVQRVAASDGGDENQVVREMLQSEANVHLGDWFEFVVGPPVMDLTAAPYGGARYPVEARMDERIFARFHLDAGIGDVVMRPLETIVCRK
jgi:hypothetical protein